ncbi:MAG: methionine ABC transporter ATP-binding protein [Anaeroplasmataceae bacterium]|nr:methionine ABC transporter ATP-binding protein [Anaeroplasmataceae bacterium]
MIEFMDITKKYHNLTALEHINLKIEDDEIFGLVGPSGAGKSTLLRTINRLEELDDGQIMVDGVIVSELKGKELREYRKNVSMIFQHFSLLETQTVYQNIALPLKCAKWKRKAIEGRVNELLQIVGLEDKKNVKPRALSGGQKQRVAIARAIALNPKILLCDEATSALDPATTKSILDLLKKIHEKLHITIVIVTHQMEVVKQICKRVAILKEGKIMEVGLTEDLFLSSNESLKSITASEEILPESGINIKIYFPKSFTSQALITKMARTLDIDFSIVWGKLEQFMDDVLGSLIINIEEKHLDSVLAYLKKEECRFEVMNDEK